MMDSVFDLVKVQLGIDAQELCIEHQESGLTNRNYMIAAGGQKYVVRLGGLKAGDLGINRRAEYAAAKEAERAGIGAEMLYFSEESGNMITRFIDGKKWSFEEFAEQEVIQRCAEAIKKVHSMPVINYEFSPYKDIGDRIEIARQRGLELPEYLDALLEKLAEVRERLEKDGGIYRGLCHNDPFANNFIDADTVRLIDWEYAGMGDVFYDLACMASFYNEAQKELLLKAYFGHTTEKMLERLNTIQFVVTFWNAMWAVLQSENNEGDCDYMEMSRGMFSSIKP